MNKTKRRIFDSAMKLFAQNGYNATTIEDITNTIGMAKGTLYYHFKSKEEIYEYLITEGINLLINSVDIKCSKYLDHVNKIKAILLIEAKIIFKYEDLIKILLSDFWGDGQNNKKCKIQVGRYISHIENIIKCAIDENAISCTNYKFLSSQIYSLICLGILYKEKMQDICVLDLYKLFEETIFNNIEININN